MDELARAKRYGKRLGPGIYEYGDSLHADVIEVVLECGGNPLVPGDVEMAQAVLAETARELFPEIEVQVTDQARQN